MATRCSAATFSVQWAESTRSMNLTTNLPEEFYAFLDEKNSISIMDSSNRSLGLHRLGAPIIHLDTSAVSSRRELDSQNSNKQDGNKLAAPVWLTPSNSSTRSAEESSSVPKSPAVSEISQYSASPGNMLHEAQADVLAPHPGDEDLFRIEGHNPFAFSPGQLGRLINPKSHQAFLALGGLPGLQRGLRTNVESGISLDEGGLSGSVSFEDATSPDTPTHKMAETEDALRRGPYADRKRVFGTNILPEKKSKTLLQLIWMALQDKVLILLSIAAAVSLALGLYQTFGTTHHDGAKVEWVEGVAIIIAIIIVALVGALNDWQKERQFAKLNRKKEDRLVKVIRSGKPTTLSIHDLLVGDVMILEQGEVIPVDGIFIDGHNISCDESSATGESDLIKKTPADKVLRTIKSNEPNPAIKKLDPFIISGAKVLDGVGTCLVTAVGPHSSHGRTMLSLRDDGEATPLQFKLNKLAGYIAMLGGAAGGLLFFVLFLEFLARLGHNDRSAEEKAQNFMRILITAITIIVVAVPEGLPLAVTLSLAFATKRMTKENNLVRHLQSCETMGNATVICSDKTGTLTENVMTVVAGSLGAGSLCFGDSELLPRDVQPATPTSQSEDVPDAYGSLQGSASLRASSSPCIRKHIATSEISASLSSELRELLKESVVANTTAFEGEEKGKAIFIGTKTETALLDWVRRCFGLAQLGTERCNYPIQELFPFNSGRKCMGAVTRLPNGRFRLLVKGAPEILLEKCKSFLEADEALRATPLAQAQRDTIRRIISVYASLSLRTLALCYRDVSEWPDESITVEFDDVFEHMTWIGLVAIQDPVRKGVPAAVGDCRRASVGVKMVTGDNVETARAIARECRLLTSEKDLVMEGIVFRSLPESERAAMVDSLRVLARSSPEDKRILVKALQAQGHIVAVTGDGTNDAPALKAADVGFSMGITGTEVAKEASDIILMDDNFSSIVKALAWGRAINDSVKKFLQFQVTVNITAVFLTFITAVSSESERSVLNAVQLLWVNLIMDTFAALALATDPPNGSLLDRKPEPKTSALINMTMWKMIIGQSIYQLTVALVLYYAGPQFLHYPLEQHRTLIFNTFVFMQIFKLVNSRRIDNKLNIFEGLHRNHLFMLIAAIMVAGQILIIFIGSDAFGVERLNGPQWAISLILGFFSIPVGVLIRLVPDSAFETAARPFIAAMKFIATYAAAFARAVRSLFKAITPECLRRKKGKEKPEVLPTDIERANYDLNAAMQDLKDDLAYWRFRGGRMKQFEMKAMMKAKKLAAMEPESPRPPRRGSVSSNSRIAPAMGVPGLLAASISGLTPTEQRKHV